LFWRVTQLISKALSDYVPAMMFSTWHGTINVSIWL